MKNIRDILGLCMKMRSSETDESKAGVSLHSPLAFSPSACPFPAFGSTEASDGFLNTDVAGLGTSF